jgi:hypothetical protein
MSTDERRPEERTVPPATGSSEDPAAVVAARDAGDAFLRAADAAIDRALSGTPEAFLSQNRQLGGQ